MMKPIRTLGAAVVALAAPALFALPASAQASVASIETRLGDSTTLTLAIGSAGYDSYRRDAYDWRRGLNYWGQTEREARALHREAVRACADAVREEAYYLGFRDVDIDDDRRTRQVSRQGFLVHFDDVEFEDRRHDVRTRVSCDVHRGRVTSIEGLPRPVKGKPPRGRW